MRLAQSWMIARHDMGLFWHKRGIVTGLIALPLGVGIGFPLLVWDIVRRGTGSLESYLPDLVNAFSIWWIIGAAILPTAIAAYGIVGEKVERSLEPLLSTPTTDSEILLGKMLAAFVPTMLAVWAGSVLYQVLIDLLTQGSLGYLLFPSWGMALILFVMAPLACLYAIEFSVIISSRATDARSAQQYAGIVFVPLIFLYVAGEIGFFPLDATNLLYIAAGLAVLVVALFYTSVRMFRREEILTQWK
ncbi:MAG: ABC transporter permease subunit [Thermoplasmata archaeon]